MQVLDDIINLIDRSILEDADTLISAGNIIKQGFDAEIDDLRDIQSKGHTWILTYQKELIAQTKIPNLKIKYTQNSGYFIEITKVHTSQIPENFIFRQSLLQASRFTTLELQIFEKKLFSSTELLAEKEYNAFLMIRNDITKHFSYIYNISRKLEYIDFLSNGAYLARERGYILPHISEKYTLSIEAGKHPILSIKERNFISNDLHIDTKNFIHVITGPNMGGKSTFLRQNALLILMAHMGYHIPAQKAEIGKVDKIFSRVGSGDNIFLGQSTFMVEMQEISYILRNATKRSFVIIDEIGRGTSTYDGMSLAWSILQYIHDIIQVKTLFATHYHEIIDHATSLKGIQNFSVAVGENNESIIFLRKIIPGGIKKSYGIEVAKLAGLPEHVLQHARKMMKDLEVSHTNIQMSLSLEAKESIGREASQDSMFGEVSSKIKDIDINTLTPLEAFHLLIQIQEQLKK